MRAMLRHRRSLPVLALVLTLAFAGGMLLTGNATRAHDDRGAYLGVHIDDSRGDPDGARIVTVIEGSPADRAGLEAGDVVIAFDGDEIASRRALSRKIDARRPGDRVDVTVVRDGRERTLPVELGDAEELIDRMFGENLGERIAESIAESMKGLEGLRSLEGPDLEGLEALEDFHFDFDLEGLHENMEGLHEQLRNFDFRVCDGGDCSFVWHGGSRPLLGVQVAETTPELRRHLGGDEDAGVLIARVYEDSPAELAGIEVGDLIVAIDGEPVSAGGDIRRAIRDRAGETLRLEIVRDGSPLDLSVDLPEADGDDSPARWRRPGSQERRELLRSAIEARREAATHARAALTGARELARSQRRQAIETARDALRRAREEQRRALRGGREAVLL